jgi:hypothetical protein
MRPERASRWSGPKRLSGGGWKTLHGLGTQLTSARLEALARVADTAWYFVNAKNQASIALHAKFGFIEHARSERIAGVDFNGGEGILFRCDL